MGYKPGATTTGPRGIADKDLVVVDGDLVVTSPGTYQGLMVMGCIICRCAGPIIVDTCLVRGRRTLPTDVTGLIDGRHASVTDLRVTNTEIAPDYPSEFYEGIDGHHWIAEQNDIYFVCDGLNSYPTSGKGHCEARRNYIHDLSPFYPDKYHQDGTHNDCWQIAGGTENISEENNYEAFLAPQWVRTRAGQPVGNIQRPSSANATKAQAMSALMLTPNVSQCKVQSKGDYMSGGIYGQVNVDTRIVNYGSVVDGKFGYDSKTGPTWTLNTNKKPGIQSGNTYEVDGKPIVLH